MTTIQDADIICVLKDGAIVEMGTHEELFKIKGFYYKFYRLQSESLTSWCINTKYIFFSIFKYGINIFSSYSPMDKTYLDIVKRV